MTIDPFGLTDIVKTATGDGVGDSPFENRMLAFMEGTSGALIAIAQQLAEDFDQRAKSDEKLERIAMGLERIADALEADEAWPVVVQ